MRESALPSVDERETGWSCPRCGGSIRYVKVREDDGFVVKEEFVCSKCGWREEW